MNESAELVDDDNSNKRKRYETNQESDDVIDVSLILTDVEYAVQSLLVRTRHTQHVVPRIIFKHQLFPIIKDKSTVSCMSK